MFPDLSCGNRKPAEVRKSQMHFTADFVMIITGSKELALHSLWKPWKVFVLEFLCMTFSNLIQFGQNLEYTSDNSGLLHQKLREITPGIRSSGGDNLMYLWPVLQQ